MLKSNLQKYILIFSILIFLVFTLVLAFNIKMGISSDSWYHLRVSEAYSTTILIPNNTPDTYQWRDISNIPYLNFWINGRVININDTFFNFNPIILLRILNIIYSLGTVIGVYLLSKEVIKNKWVRLLPIVFLTNTLMFLMLSSSINYDNLGNMFATFSILFFIKTVKNLGTIKYPLLTILMLCLGALTKFTILPLAFIIVLLLVYILLKDWNIWKESLKGKELLLIFPILVFGMLNLLLYGNNILKYGELTPSCEKILTYEQCLTNGVFYRDEISIPATKERTLDLILSGQRIDPIRYTGIWVWEMTKRVVGIMGDDSLYHSNFVVFIFTFFIFLISVIGIKNRKYFTKESKYLFIITISYLLILMIAQNYNMYLKRGYPTLALQGRYMFPVISSLYVFISYTLMTIPNTKLKKLLIFTLLFLLISLSIPYFILNVDPNWFGTITSY